MTGAAAGQAGGAQAGGDAAGNGEAQGPGNGQGQPDLAALASTFGDDKAGQEELRQQIQQLLQAQPWAEGQPAAGEGDDAGDEDATSDELGDDDGIDLSFLDSGDPEATAEALADIFDRAVGEQMKPLHAELASQRGELADQRQERAFEHLAAEIPALQDPDVAQAVGKAAQELAEAMGRPDLAGDAHFWKLTAMAIKAAELANEEDAETPSAAHLEGGGGAAPAGAQVDPLGPMFAANVGGKSVLPFQG